MTGERAKLPAEAHVGVGEVGDVGINVGEDGVDMGKLLAGD